MEKPVQKTEPVIKTEPVQKTETKTVEETVKKSVEKEEKAVKTTPDDHNIITSKSLKESSQNMKIQYPNRYWVHIKDDTGNYIWKESIGAKSVTLEGFGTLDLFIERNEKSGIWFYCKNENAQSGIFVWQPNL
jgi:myosin-crossreactive antigen